MEIKISKNTLTVDLYKSIRKTAGFLSYSDIDIKEALKNSLYTVVVYCDARAVGIARVVGDNRVAFFIKDVVVIPEFQQMGVGDIIMKNIFEYLNENAAKNAYVGLMSTPGKERFYEKYGFIERPTKSLGSGMVMFYDKKE